MDKKVSKWLEKGIINEKTAAEIDADIKEEKEKNRRFRMNIAVYTIASVFIGTGVISFIAANAWIFALFEKFEILKILSVLLLACGSLFFGRKLYCEIKNYSKLGYFLITLSAFLIGGTYAVTGQTYNINSGASALYMLWLISILPLAYIFKNSAINMLSVVLFCIWTILQYLGIDSSNEFALWMFLPVLIGLTLYLTGNISFIRDNFAKFSLQYKITGLNAIYIILLILVCYVEKSYDLKEPVYLIPLCILIAGNIINYIVSKRKNDDLFITETVISVLLAFGLLLICNLVDVNTVAVALFVHLILILIIIFGFYYGYKEEKEQVVGISNKFLVIYFLVTYCRWGWTFMDKSLFFILGGLMFLALGIYLERKKKSIFLPVRQLKNGEKNGEQ